MPTTLTNRSNPGKRNMNATIEPGRYRHYKGNDYQVYSVVTHSETLEPLVLYRALYGDKGLWVRPLSMFLETVDVNGETLARFSLVDASTESPKEFS